ncbi:LRR receptor-like serine threonine-protein kinase [Seminavis robusta]|uniref:LRR receptor-like serine threonine-protein kinase n=1 Tax=Seminavis robusta TaxID=568900 RepID=A0A9N8HPA0_9STRA|nr:LRR receptor-like serine threonine-protein kinase [Seminavis robusta]|eukprot:Sro885_g216120.1 LRR receptor-like serine threonine-protein kinase (886) ;mRNA; r:29638-32295
MNKESEVHQNSEKGPNNLDGASSGTGTAGSIPKSANGKDECMKSIPYETQTAAMIPPAIVQRMVGNSFGTSVDSKFIDRKVGVIKERNYSPTIRHNDDEEAPAAEINFSVQPRTQPEAGNNVGTAVDSKFIDREVRVIMEKNSCITLPQNKEAPAAEVNFSVQPRPQPEVGNDFGTAVDSKFIDREVGAIKEKHCCPAIPQNSEVPAADNNSSVQPRPQPGAYNVRGPAMAVPSELESGHANDESVHQDASSNAPWDFLGGVRTMNNSSTQLEASKDLARAKPVQSEQFNVGDLPQAEIVDHVELEKQESKQLQHKQEWNQRVIGFAIFALACLSLGLILGLLLRKSGEALIIVSPTVAPSIPPTGTPSSAPTRALDALLQDLPDSTLQRLDNISTSQWQAVDWLSRHPDLPNMETWRQIQLFALANFYYAFEGPNWREVIRNRWMLYDTSECFWFSSAYGKFSDDGPNYIDEIRNDVDPCNDQGRIQTLILDDLELAGFRPYIPLEIELLSSLSYLALRRNGINATLSSLMPSSIYQMPNLTFLALNNNEMMSGRIPSELGMLTTLKELKLDDCSLSGTLPSELGSLTNLIEIELQRNKNLEGPIPSEYGMMNSLMDLSMNQNKLSGSLPSELFQMSSLAELDLVKNKFTGTLPAELGLLTGITDLRARINEFSGTIPSELGVLTRLSRLNLGGNSLEGTIPSEIGNLANMEKLYFEGTSLSGPIPSECGLMVHATRFYVDENHLSVIPREFWQMTNMEKLRLQKNLFSGPLPSEIGDLRRIKEVEAYGNFFSGALPSELALLTSMTALLLHGNQLSGSIPFELSMLASNGSLELLTLSGNPLSGIVPEELCALGQYNTTTKDPVGLDFDCGGLLCGCGWCRCG